MDYKEFIAWEKASRDTIDFKKVYVDMTGDIVTGLLLSQIIYWHLPNKKGETKLRVRKNGKLYLVKRRADWWDECRISEEQYKRASKKLRKLGIIETEIYRFNNFPTTHIWLNWDCFLNLYDAVLNPVPVKSPETETVNTPEWQTGETPGTLTKTCTDYPTQNTVNPPPVPPIQWGSGRLKPTYSHSHKHTFKTKEECKRERDRQLKALNEVHILAS